MSNRMTDPAAMGALWQQNTDLKAEVERLRTENKLLQGDKAAWIDVLDTIRKECDPQTLEACEGYVFRCVAKMRAQLEWFRRREQDVVQRLLDDAGVDDIEFAREWEAANTKPGAGELATACTAEDTNVLSDSYAKFVKGSKQGVGT